jgi:hypothetical protein
MATVVTAIAVPPIRHAIARWTDEIFTFEKGGEYIVEETTPHTPAPPSEKEVQYPDMLRTLEEYGITEPLAPTWIPEGFNVKEFYVEGETSFSRVYTMLEKDENTSIIIQIKLSPEDIENTHEKDELNVTVYEKEGVPYYIMTNKAREKAVWTYGEYEGSISVSGSVDHETLIRIIDSIYER